MKRLSFFPVLMILCFALSAQYNTNLVPRISADNSISERVAYTKISIEYGSPKVRGRAIWGDMEEYGQIWRAGANKATRISFSEDVKIDDRELVAGDYSLFVIPRDKKPWTIIFNKVADQWGAFNYSEKEDALRIEVMPTLNNHVEDLTYDIIADGFNGAFVILEWERIKLSFYVAVEHLRILEKKVEETLLLAPENTEWVIYLQAANYLIEENANLNQAAEWLDKSLALIPNVKDWSGQYYPIEYIKGDLLWAKARLAALQKDYQTAIKYAEDMKRIDGEYLFYERENEYERIDEQVAIWKLKG